MTAEIAVLNRTAVALAADSASTSVQSSGLPKIFNTADKLFHLDGIRPIGVMVYGNSHFMGVPWETIIKEYRGAAPQSCDTLAEAAEGFLAFLASPQLMSDAHIAQFVEIHIGDLSREVLTALTSEVARLGGGTTREQVLGDILIRISALPLMPGFAAQHIAHFIGQWDQQLDAAIASTFAAAPLQDVQRNQVKELIARVNLTVPREEDGAVSGVVLAGFGETELFPVLWNCLLRSLMAARLLQRTPGEVEPLRMPLVSMIRAFAQKEMVHSFIWGIDPNLHQTFDNTVVNLMQRLTGHLGAQTGFAGQQLADFQNAANAIVASLTQNLRTEIDRYCRDKHVDPVLQAVGMLPKDQLAVMAETLVSLTSFKRKMSRDAETVGGDVDVAVVSKGDGFVWVKRKHYFPAELNLRYAHRISQNPPP
jgi:hypothetical protein